jgi:uncharacterized protein
MKKIIFLLIISIPFILSAHGFDEMEQTIFSKGLGISGTLTLPAHAHDAMPLVIIIAGSGPTDRDCNGQGFKSNAYKKMASTFALNRIATYRYDKRGVGKSALADQKEEDLNFMDMVDDAKAVILNFEKDKRFNKLIIVGHSEGSLVGIMAVGEKHKFVSLSGVSDAADVVLKEQLKGKLGNLETSTFSKLDSLKKGNKVTCDNFMLSSLLRPSVQPYLISWFKLNPCNELKKLSCPVLIVNGTKDIQVNEKNAQALNKVTKNSRLLIVPNMNHVLTEIVSEKLEDNTASYNLPDLPLSKKMMDEIILFIH